MANLKENELLDKDIQDKISDVRYQKPEKKDEHRSIFYLAVVALVTLAVIVSMLRFL